MLASNQGCGCHGSGMGRRRGMGMGMGGRRGRGDRVFAHGDLRIALLALLAEQPRHGYDLIRTIEDRFAGSYTPSPGAVYPTLTLLEEQGLIQPQAPDPAGDGKRRFELTAAGAAFLEANKASVEGVMTRMALAGRALSGQMTPEHIIQAMQTLRQALTLHPGAWSESETLRVQTIIEQAARQITGG